MAVREGSLEAPTRHPLDWKSGAFYDPAALDKELERVYGICHGCRRCVNLCTAFPTLFDLIDESKTMEIDGVAKQDYWKVIDQCYLCDMCYMTKCPYVPPHPWNVDFPHLMLRAKAVKFGKDGARLRDRLPPSTDAIGKLATIPVAGQTVNALNRNRAADGPASLVISEQMRGQIASIGQAIQNSEASISMVQTAEAALNEVASLLVSMRQLAIHAANEGANDQKMLAADQFEIENALQTIDPIARTSQFGTRTLLDGSNGASGVAVGDGMEFVSAAPGTHSSPAEGYPVNITRAATRAEKVGARAIKIEDLRPTDMNRLVKGFKIMVSEGGKNISFDLDGREDGDVIRKLLAEMDRNPAQFNRALVESNIRHTIAENLQRKAESNGLKVNVYLTHVPGVDGEVLAVRDKEFGSKPTFFVGSTVPGVLAVEPNRFEEAAPGRDVEGTIDGKIAVGTGEFLHGAESTNVQGLVVRFNPVREIKQRFPKFIARGPEVIPNPDIAKVNENTPPEPGARLMGKEEDGEHVVFTWEAPAKVDRNPDGYVHISQNSLAFQVGPTRGQQVKISLIDAKTDRL